MDGTAASYGARGLEQAGMKDNNEGGSRDAGSAHPQPAQPTIAPTSDAGLHDSGALHETAGSPSSDAGDEVGLRPVSADMQQFIGRQLRAVFDDVAKQPVPDRFLELMKQLDSKTEAR